MQISHDTSLTFFVCMVFQVITNLYLEIAYYLRVYFSYLCHNKKPTRIETIKIKARDPAKMYGQVGSSSKKTKVVTNYIRKQS